MTAPTKPSPETFFETMNAYQRTAALKAALELDVFTTMAEGADTVSAIAKRCAASERGIRSLCNYLTVIHLLTKSGDHYQLTPDSATFLVKSSPAYLGGTLAFLASSDITRNFDALAATIRRGTLPVEASTVAGHEQDHWVQFARAMAPMAMLTAMAMADALQISTTGPVRILDIAAGHGMYGIALAQRNPKADVVALDWPGVLAVAAANAARMGVSDRHHPLPGDAFTVDYGTGYDIVLLTNFLHHYDTATNMTLLRKVAAALKPGGRLAIAEFVPNDDRVTPPVPAAFTLTMLAGTPLGDVYTLAQLQQMATEAGFKAVSAYPQSPAPQTVVLATK